MENMKEELSEQEQTILRNHVKDFFERWKRDQEEQEWYGRKLYIFEYHEIYDEYTDEVENVYLINKHIVKADDEDWDIAEINEEIDVSFTFKSRR